MLNETRFRNLSIIPRVNLNRIVYAILLAFHAYEDQERKAGGPYIVHPLHVALQAFAMGASTETIMTALLRDVVEDTDVSLDEIATRFGDRVATTVASLTKPPKSTPNRAAIYRKHTWLFPEKRNSLRFLILKVISMMQIQHFHQKK